MFMREKVEFSVANWSAARVTAIPPIGRRIVVKKSVSPPKVVYRRKNRSGEGQLIKLDVTTQYIKRCWESNRPVSTSSL